MADSDEGRPERNLFGGRLRENFEDQAARRGFVLFPARVPSPVVIPTGAKAEAAKKLESDWRSKTSASLQPTLSFLDRSGVEAVGVFGGNREDILAMVHDRLPGAYLFTTDADWSLEAPHPPPRPRLGEVTPGDASNASSQPQAPYPLEGLLVATSPEPPRDWTREEMAQLSYVSPEGSAFLPDLEIYYAGHIVKRLVEMLQGGRIAELRAGTGKGRAEAARKLSAALHATTRLGNSEVLESEGDDFHDGWEAHRPEFVRIKAGRLEPMSDTGQALKTIVGVVLGLVIAVGLVRIRDPGSLRSASGAPRSNKGRAAAMSVPMAILSGSMATIGMLTLLCLDRWFFTAPVSFSVLPDGHSVLPSVALLAAAAAFCWVMPRRFRSELSRLELDLHASPFAPGDSTLGLSRWWRPLDAPVETSFRARVKVWLDRRVRDHLKTSRREMICSLALAFLLSTSDAWGGYPVAGASSSPWRFGFAIVALYVGEMFVLYLIITTGWTFVEMMKAATCLLTELAAPRRDDGGNGPAIRPREIDPEGLRRLGGLFIEMVAYGLLVFGLVLVARLPGLGMARWRWEFRFLHVVVPIAWVLFGLGLVLIVCYWAFCYQTFVSLIREVKNDRIRELEEFRLAKSNEWTQFEAERAAAIGREETPPEPPFDWPDVSKALEDEKQKIHEISEKPWEADDSRPAWRALTVALLPALLSLILGGWGGTWSDPIKKAIAALLAGG